MTDYFFISSPLHFFISANIASKFPSHKSIAIIISKNKAVAERYAAATKNLPQIFEDVILLAGGTEKLSTFRGKSRLRTLKRVFSRPAEMRIFTGNDRRIEFQYAMHAASKFNGKIEGIYMDDGTVTYLGHKSMKKMQHRYIDPVLKKIFYGLWWKNAVTTGTSAWIDSAYVAFPESVHPLLKRKKLVALDGAAFKSDLFRSLASALLEKDESIQEVLNSTKAIISLPHEDRYLNRPQTYHEISQGLRNHFDAKDVAVKPHPRIKNHAVIKSIFPGFKVLDHSIGMEILLPFLKDDCVVIGDISTTLLTTRWLRPDLPVLAFIDSDRVSKEMVDLYRNLDIPVIGPDQLGEKLREVNCGER